jgi:hypothetical protein
MARLRAGVQRIENGLEIPTGVIEFLSKSGRKCYLSGVTNLGYKFVATVRYIDDGSFVEVDYEKIKDRIICN